MCICGAIGAPLHKIGFEYVRGGGFVAQLVNNSNNNNMCEHTCSHCNCGVADGVRRRRPTPSHW
jgi:hypothetical protein